MQVDEDKRTDFTALQIHKTLPNTWELTFLLISFHNYGCRFSCFHVALQCHATLLPPNPNTFGAFV